MNTKKYLSFIAILGTLTSLAVAIPAFAAETAGQGKARSPMQEQREQRPMMRSTILGKVLTISGNTLTVTSIRGRVASSTSSTNTTFTVDATNAVIMTNNATSSISNIVVGEYIAIQGPITGTNIVATRINSGIMKGKAGAPGQINQNEAKGELSITGNGEPVVAGVISAINGNSITITNKSNVTYTVDATNAKISQGQNASGTISNLTVGDSILTQGTVNGTSVAATTIIDQTNKNSNSASTPGAAKGFLSGVGQFFMHLFGF